MGVLNEAKVWFSPLQGKYYSEDEIYCSNCENECIGAAMQVLTWSKKSKSSFICLKCKPQKGFYRIAQARMIILSSVPVDAFPILERPPALQSGNMDVFEAANLDTEDTLDHTVHSGRTMSFEGMQIGASVMSDEDIGITEAQVIKLLEETQKASQSVMRVDEVEDD